MVKTISRNFNELNNPTPQITHTRIQNCTNKLNNSIISDHQLPLTSTTIQFSLRSLMALHQLSLMTRRLILIRTRIPKLPSHSGRLFCSSDDQPKKPNPDLRLPSKSEAQYRMLLEQLESGSVDLKEARKVVEEMVERGIKFTGKECVSIMVSFSICGLDNEGKQLLKMVRDKGLGPEEAKVMEVLKVKRGPVYRSIMEALYDKSPQKMMKEALEWYLLMTQKGLSPDAYTHHMLLYGLCEHGDVETVKEVRKIVEEMIKSGIKVGDRACVSIMAGFIRVGLKNEGKQVLKMVKDNGLGPEKDKVNDALKEEGNTVYHSVMEALYGSK